MAENTSFTKKMPSSKERRMSLLQEDDHLADCEFLVGESTGEEKPRSFRCHKMILATASEVFERMLYGDFDVAGPILVQEVGATSFERFLRYVYIYEFDAEPKLSTQELCELLYLAEKYMMQDLTDVIVEYLKSDHKWTLGDIWPIYNIACLHENLPLMLISYAEISKYDVELLLSDDSFYGVSPHHLKRIVILLGQKRGKLATQILKKLEEYGRRNQLHEKRDSEEFLKLVEAATKLDFNYISKDDFTASYLLNQKNSSK